MPSLSMPVGPPATLTTEHLAEPIDDSSSPTESTPLLASTSHLDGAHSYVLEDVGKMTMFREEMQTIPRYIVPIFGYVLLDGAFTGFDEFVLTNNSHSRAQILEYSLVLVPVISVGHISTIALAAISLG